MQEMRIEEVSRVEECGLHGIHQNNGENQLSER